MKEKIKIKTSAIFILVIGIIMNLSCFGQKTETVFKIGVDPRLELLSIIQSLTNWPNIGGFTTFDFQYYQDVKSYFGEYKNHPMVKWYDANLKRNWGYNAAPAAMLFLSNPPEMKLIEPFPEYIIKRGKGEENLNRMVDLMNQFVKDTDFIRFWEEHQTFYEEFEQKINDKIPFEEYIQLMKEFYGEEKANFVFIPVPLFLRGGYAADTNEGQVVYFIGGPHKLEDGFPVYDSKILRMLVFHEFGHTFTKPVVNEYEDLLMKHRHLFKYMKKPMKELTYTDWITTCDENFVRCGEYFLLRLAGFPEESQEGYERDLKRGFLLLPFIRGKMEIYVNNRNKFASFKEYFPSIIESFDEIEPTFQKKFP